MCRKDGRGHELFALLIGDDGFIEAGARNGVHYDINYYPGLFL